MPISLQPDILSDRVTESLEQLDLTQWRIERRKGIRGGVEGREKEERKKKEKKCAHCKKTQTWLIPLIPRRIKDGEKVYCCFFNQQEKCSYLRTVINLQEEITRRRMRWRRANKEFQSEEEERKKRIPIPSFCELVCRIPSPIHTIFFLSPFLCFPDSVSRISIYLSFVFCIKVRKRNKKEYNPKNTRPNDWVTGHDSHSFQKENYINDDLENDGLFCFFSINYSWSIWLCLIYKRMKREEEAERDYDEVFGDDGVANLIEVCIVCSSFSSSPSEL